MRRTRQVVVIDNDGAEDAGPIGLLRGASKAMRNVRDALDRVAQCNWTVLLEGAPGTGKTNAASYIHLRSDRRDGPFVVCSASQLMDGLALSELLGHTRGAFTGALVDHAGAFEAAHGGTLFIDEVQTASPLVQAMLLPLIPDTRRGIKLKRLGERRTRSPDVRVLAASNVPLRQEVSAGRFRLDLHDRLNDLPVTMPSLVERREDIRPLFRHYMIELCKEVRREPVEPGAAEWTILEAYHWPGNVRELIGAVKYYVAFDRLRAEIVPENWRAVVPDVYRETDNNIAATARLVGKSRPSVYAELQRIDGSST